MGCKINKTRLVVSWNIWSFLPFIQANITCQICAFLVPSFDNPMWCLLDGVTLKWGPRKSTCITLCHRHCQLRVISSIRFFQNMSYGKNLAVFKTHSLVIAMRRLFYSDARSCKHTPQTHDNVHTQALRIITGAMKLHQVKPVTCCYSTTHWT